MTIIVPNVGESAIAKRILDQALILKLFSNNMTPDELTTTSSLAEVTGGGYNNVILNYENWTIIDGYSIYTPVNFLFTGLVSGPGEIYGYYIVDPNDVLLWIERFPTSAVPFVPVANSLIRITPRIRVS